MSSNYGRDNRQQPFLLLITIPVILALLLGLAGTALFVRSTRPQQLQQELGQAGQAPGSTSPGVVGKGAVLAPSSAPSATPPTTPQRDPCSSALTHSAASVQVGLARTFAPGPVVSFGLPLPAGALTDIGALRVTAAGVPVAATTRTLLTSYSPEGTPQGVRSILVQLPTSVLQGDCTAVEVSWQAGAAATAPGPNPQPYAAVSVESPELVTTATRTIERRNGVATLVETKREQRTLFTGREPAVLATFPPGYLAATGILGHQIAAAQLGPDLAGLQFITDQITPFGLSAMYQERYALHPASVIGPNDTDEQKEINGYEGWLYDRCATYLLFAATTGDTRFLREGFRSCSFYAGKIELQGENRGLLTITPEPDDKFSHLRGLYAYYALTGDEAALAAGEAIAEMWMKDPYVLTPYRAGRLRGPDKLWTERQLGTGLEGLFYGHLLTGDVAYLRATQELITTMHRHITGDAAALAAINPGSVQFPPQNCLIHNAEQAAEGDADQPWCSGWMQILMVDAMLAYQDQTNDPRIDEMFIRLARFLRDVGTAYFAQGGETQGDFLHPPVAYDARQELTERRVLVPLYGSGIDNTGKRQNFGEYDDYLHCLDASSLTAVALRALKRTGTYDRNPVGPFPSEGESFLALHHEFAFCAYVAFAIDTRAARDPASYPPEYLEEGLRNPAKYIDENEIGYPLHNTSPQRKLSWWYNASLAQFALLREAGISIPELRPGAIQPTRSTQSPQVQHSFAPATQPLAPLRTQATRPQSARRTSTPEKTLATKNTH